MKRILQCAAVCLLVCAAHAQTAPAHANNPFGLMLPWAWDQPAKAAQFAQSMGVSSYRPLSIYLDRPLLCAECVSARQRGLDLIITVRNNGGGAEGQRQATTPPGDLNAYRTAIQSAAAKWQPLLLVIENEENSRIFYAGTAQQYLAQLKIACDVAHAASVPCADGGLTSRAVVALTIQSYLREGRHDAAISLARRTVAPQVATVAQLQQLLARFSDELTKAETLLNGISDAGADYLNFHWYESDPQALGEIVEFLRVTSGLPVITNELGQRNDDPADTTAKLQTVLDLGLEMAVWYSTDGPQARSLLDATGKLRPTGLAFRDFMRKQFAPKR